jgi:ankyrin repeat protein
MHLTRTAFALLVASTLVFGEAVAGPVHDAARDGDIELLKRLLSDDHLLVDARDGNRMTPLHHAIDGGALDIAALLIERGADVDATNYHEETPLHLAAYAGDSEATELLVKSGADVAKREMRNRIPLFLACNWGHDLETVRLLIEAGSDVNDKNARGEYVLVSTLFYGAKEIIDLLMDSGAVIPDEEDILKRVLYVTASNGLERPFAVAVEKSEALGLEWWAEVPMHACARGGGVSIAETLIDKGADPFKENKYGVTPLHIAAENGRGEFVEFLLLLGADVDDPCRTGKTAWHFALENGHQEVVEILIANGASEAPAEFPLIEGDYLGQPVPGDAPELFAPGIVSGHGFSSEHSPAVFSPDGNEVYWTKKFKGPILFMERSNGAWSEPKPAPFCSEYGDGEPMFSPDGEKLFFLSLRPTEPDGATDKENIWFVDRTADGWSDPRPVSPAINEFDLHWLFSVSENGTIYFASTRDGGFGAHDIYCSSLVDGEYGGPVNLGEVINSEGIEHTPYIAPDDSYLIYVISGKNPGEGSFQFHISYRREDGAWTAPINLGEKINSIGWSLCPYITPDGKYMFFIGEGDIYWVDAGFIGSLRPPD